MKTNRLLFVVGVVAAVWGGFDARAADEMSVQVKVTQVRDKDSYLGRPLYELNFGDRVMVLQKGSAWFKVQPVNTAAVKLSPGVSAADAKDFAGYVNKSALTPKRIVLKGDQNAAATASSENVALAGKGFNDEVERAYQAGHPQLTAAFAALDRIETSPTYAPTAEEISAFRAAGGLNGGGR